MHPNQAHQMAAAIPTTRSSIREFDGPAPRKSRNSMPMEVTASALPGSSPEAGRRVVIPIRQPLSAGVCHRAGAMTDIAIQDPAPRNPFLSLSFHPHSQRN